VERAKAAAKGTVLLFTGLRVGDADDAEVELHGDIAIVNRSNQIEDPDGSQRCLRSVRVYQRQDAAWRLLSHRYIHAVD
jgi:hypothetical protein